MFPLTFPRPSMRRPVLALLVLGGLMATSPVRAALPTSELLGDTQPSAGVTFESSAQAGAEPAGLLPGNLLGGDLLGGDLVGSLLSGALPGTDLLGGDLVGSVLSGGLPGADLLGGDLVGGLLSGGLPGADLLGGDLVGGLLSGGLPGSDLLGGAVGLDLLGGDALGGDLLGGVLGGGGDADPPAGTSGTEGDSGGIHIGGAHIGVRGQNPLETLLGLGCEDTNGIIRTSIQGIALQLPVAVAGLLCPDGSPSEPPGSPSSPAPDPDPEVLPAAETRPNPGTFMTPPPATPVVTPPLLDASVDLGAPTGPVARTTLPRTGASWLFQGPVALGLLGASAALRMAIRRRRPGVS